MAGTNIFPGDQDGIFTADVSALPAINRDFLVMFFRLD
jgi:hypothetical protein